MRRRLFTLAICLLLGAVVNVAVAWGCALGHTDYMNNEKHPPALDDLRWWKERAPQGFPLQPVGAADSYGFGLTFTLLWELEWEVHHTLGDNAWRFRAGLPMRSMEQSVWVERSKRLVVEQDLARIPLWWSSNDVLVPLRRLWLAFAVNSLFYAIVSASVLASIVALRRVIRRKRAHCIKCSYDLRGAEHETCPECGAVCGPSTVASG